MRLAARKGQGAYHWMILKVSLKTEYDSRGTRGTACLRWDLSTERTNGLHWLSINFNSEIKR